MDQRGVTYRAWRAGEGHSPEGAWWWDGHGWLPAWSADRRWWFDGRQWVVATPQRRLWFSSARWLRRAGLLAAAFVVGAAATAYFVVKHAFSAPAQVDTITPALHALLITALIAMAVGFAQGLGSSTRDVALPLVMIGATGLVIFVITALLGSYACGSEPSCDITGVPAATYTTFWAVAVLVPAALGGWLLGWTLTRARRRRGVRRQAASSAGAAHL